MSTTTWPWSRPTSRRCSTTPDRTSTHRSGRGSPVTTPRCGPIVRCTDPNRSGEHAPGGQPGGREQPGDLVEDPELLGDGTAVGVGVDQRRPASASRQLGGQPHGEGGAARGSRGTPDRQDPPARPSGRCGSLPRPGSSAPRRRRCRRRLVGQDRVGQGGQLGLGDRRADPDPGGPQPGGVQPGAVGDDRHRSHRVLAQQVDGRLVEAVGVDPEDRDVGLTGAGRGQQVVEVDTALEHDDAPPLREQGQGGRLPRGAGGDDEDDDHGA